MQFNSILSKYGRLPDADINGSQIMEMKKEIKTWQSDTKEGYEMINLKYQQN